MHLFQIQTSTPEYVLNISCNCSSPSNLLHQPTPPVCPILRPLPPINPPMLWNKQIRTRLYKTYGFHTQCNLNVLQFFLFTVIKKASQSQPLFLGAHQTPIKATGKERHSFSSQTERKTRHQISIMEHKNRRVVKCKTHTTLKKYF